MVGVPCTETGGGYGGSTGWLEGEMGACLQGLNMLLCVQLCVYLRGPRGAGAVVVGEVPTGHPGTQGLGPGTWRRRKQGWDLLVEEGDCVEHSRTTNC